MRDPTRLLVAGCVLATSWLVLRAAADSTLPQGLEVPGCGNLANAYGPYDYTNSIDVRDHLPIVETYHFDKGVQALKGQQGSGASLGADLAYTLRAFPNHHKALDALGRYQLQIQQSPVPGARYSAECYFERAMAFAPQDGTTRMVYGIYLARKGDREGSLQRYLEAQALMPDSSELQYNLGLMYANLGRYDDALEQAHKAYANGFPLMGLKNKLIKAGAWRDPPPAPPAAEPTDATAPGDVDGQAAPQPQTSDTQVEGQ